MSFGQIVSINLCSITVSMLLFLWVSRILLGRLPGWGGRRLAARVAAAFAVILIQAFLGAVCYLAGVWHWGYGLGMILWNYFVVACEGLLLQLLYRAPFRNCVLAALMVEISCVYGQILADAFVYGRVYDLSVLSELREYLFWLLVISPACLLACGLVIRLSGVGRVYRQWLEQEKSHRGILTTLLFLYPVFNYILHQQGNGSGSVGMFLLLFVSVFLMIHLIFVYAGRDREQREYIAVQEASLAQQAVYIERMEHLQSEIRRFRHDFKNMMAGMYLQAREGDLRAVQSFIQEVTEDFDRQMGDQVHLLNQLANVQAAEVKGLLLEKLSRMQKEGIRCELEVLRPFTGTRMRNTDLLRCLGILIDNAMDEVRGRKDARIYLMISSQEGCTTFLVKNKLYGEMDFQRLGKSGYTTKGEGHGIGLESYRKIVEGYDFVFPFMAVRDGDFVQELKIQEGRE